MWDCMPKKAAEEGVGFSDGVGWGAVSVLMVGDSVSLCSLSSVRPCTVTGA